jgi:hypothetical protein
MTDPTTTDRMPSEKEWTDILAGLSVGSATDHPRFVAYDECYCLSRRDCAKMAQQLVRHFAPAETAQPGNSPTTTDRLREAVEILREHNRWRRGAEDLMQLTPGKIGAAIDAVCDLVPQVDERLAKAHALLLTIWPDGERCEHRVAREIFRTLAGGVE